MTPPITYDPTGSDPWRRAVRQGFLIFLVVSAIALPVLFYAPDGSWVKGDPANADKISRILEHAAVTLISSILASLFLAIPLTANNYSPQLIEAFVGSWANRFVLGVFIVSAGYSVWLTQATTNAHVATHQIYLSFGLVALSIALLLPYVLAILRLIDPDVIISLVTGMVVTAMKTPARGEDVERRQRALLQRIDQLGNIILRSLDRADRDTALSGVQAMEYVIAKSLTDKKKKDASWFQITSRHFPGLSPEAVGYLVRDKTWVEMEMLRQLARAYTAALAKTRDVISAIVRAVRHSAVRAAAAGDRGALDLSIRFCNNFLREAVKKKDLHAIYDVVFQYRYFAETLFDNSPGVVEKMIRHLDYYAKVAVNSGIPFAHDLVAFDVASIVATAAAKRTHAVDPLIRAFLEIGAPRKGDAARPLSIGLVKARTILAVELEATGHQSFADEIERTLKSAKPETIEDARRALLETTEESFWEVTDRQTNFDYVLPANRAAVAAILDRVARSIGGAAAR